MHFAWMPFLALAGWLPGALSLSRDEIADLCASFPNSTVSIGMVTRGSTQLILDRWTPTFETYLTASLATYGCRTKLVPLDFDTYDDMVRNKEIEFVFPNPTAFQELKDKYGVNEFLSVKRNFGADNVLDRFGGVIVRSGSNFTHIMSLEDLKQYGRGMRLCAVNPNAFGGWHIQWLEMLRAGIDVDEHFTKEFLGNHNDPLRGLRNGRCDLGIARTETIERLVDAGEFNTTDFYTIGDRSLEYNFPQFLTTPLYPEWPLASLAHVSRELEQLIAIPLLTMDKTQQEAIIGDHAGFTFPFSYEPVRQLFLALDHYGDGKCDPGYQREEDFPRQCLPCRAGTYNNNGLATCLLCPVGFVNNGTGNADCEFCAAGLTTRQAGSTSGQCVPPEETVAAQNSVWSDPGTWISIGVGATALIFVLLLTVYAKKKSGSMIGVLEVLTSGMMPTIIAFFMELSDLASDTAVALTILAMADLEGFSSVMKTVYVACVAAHFVPSVFNLVNRGRALRLKASHIESSNSAPAGKPNEATASAIEAAVSATTPTSPVADFAGKSIYQDESDEEADVEVNHSALRQLVLQERRRLVRSLREDRLKTASMPPFILGMLLEDFVMSIVNAIALSTGVRSDDFRNHPVFPLLALATASSLLGMGFKVGHVGRWLMQERKQTRVNVARVKAIHGLLPELGSSPMTDSKAAGLLMRRFSSAENLLASVSSTLSRFSSFIRSPKVGRTKEVVGDVHTECSDEVVRVMDGSDIDERVGSTQLPPTSQAVPNPPAAPLVPSSIEQVNKGKVNQGQAVPLTPIG